MGDATTFPLSAASEAGIEGDRNGNPLVPADNTDRSAI